MQNIIDKFHLLLSDKLENHIRLNYKGFTLVKKYNSEEGMFILISDFNKHIYIDKIIGIVPTKTDSIYSKNEVFKIKEFTYDYNHFTFKNFYTYPQIIRMICATYSLPSFIDYYLPFGDDDYLDDEDNPDFIFTCLLWAISCNNITSIKQILSRPDGSNLILKKNIKNKTPLQFSQEHFRYEIAWILQEMTLHS